MPEPFSGITSKTIRATTTTNLENKISDYAVKVMLRRVDKAENSAVDVAKVVIQEAITNSRVYKALLGSFANVGSGLDLPAEFGLTDSMARKALVKLIEILLSTVVVTSKVDRNGRFTSVEIKAYALDPKVYEPQLRSGSEFSYISTSYRENKKAFKNAGHEATSYQIRWMEWLLDAGNPAIIASTLPNISGFGITYDLHGTDYKASRSGRAIMTRLNGKRREVINGRVKPYVMPRGALPQIPSSKNFIEDIGKDRRFIGYWSKQIHKAVYRAMKPKEPLPGYLRD